MSILDLLNTKSFLIFLMYEAFLMLLNSTFLAATHVLIQIIYNYFFSNINMYSIYLTIMYITPLS